MAAQAPHPWVTAQQTDVRFALQAVAARSSGDPGAALIRAGLLAEEHGYDAFVLGDHPAWAPDCWLHLAAVAARTSRIRLGQVVAAAPYRTPLLMARLQSDLDRLSNGRTFLGLGIGWNAADYGLGSNEFTRMGLPYPPTAERQAALEEAITIIRGLWGAEPFTYLGEHLQVAGAHIPAPMQEHGVPLMIGGGGARTLNQVARLADACNFGPGPAGNTDTPADARRRLQSLRDQCDAVGRDYDGILRSTFTHWLILAETDAEIAAKVSHYFPDGLDEFWGKYLVSGTPESVASHFQDFVDAGITYFVIQTLDPDDVETISLATRDLLPRLQLPSRA